MSQTSLHPTPLLFVHGAWHGAWCWHEHFVPYFTDAGYTVHAPDLPGHGANQSGKALRWLRVRDYVAEIARVAAALPAPPVIIGHSMGGFVVQKYLEKHPAAAAVLLASIPPRGVLDTVLRIVRRHPLRFLKANATLSLYPLVDDPALARELFFSPSMPEADVQRYFAKLQDESYSAFLDMLLFDRPQPERVRVPVLVLGAENDTIFHTYEVEATARAYHTSAKIFPGMAHNVLLEPRWRDVAGTILEWLKSSGF
jgi:pimeloyl-ACP methyl ester carboxylesterase